ncbi:L,D-transpeptidase family protein [Nocardia tengchongensis]|uniref:L,D-transpeptidase family protein n=1 Tax=Nocardia tengchongensis TaxID=2055889 RepID=A0ABX8CPX2_9NOCA|nr:Ig-like domain-containing protein [Nocardia tengchongensis]QVI21391.1 L,D-transpeptidase family protein [Nocardia tengchongensis]
MGDRRSGRRRGKLAGIGVVVTVLALALVGCSSGGKSQSASVPIDSNPIGELMKPKLISPVKDGDKGVAPGELNLKVEDGKLTAVVLSNPDGKPVPGELAVDGRSWKLAEQLAFGRTYKLSVEAIGLGGATSSTMSFTTISPNNRTHPYLLPAENELVGIGQPVAVQFDENIPDRKAAQDAIKITTTPAVEGAFYWVNNREVRWRPQNFWAPGTRVDIAVNSYGKDLGGGLVGDSDIHSGFTVGDATVFTADDNTKIVTVERNGQVIKTMPTSMGKDSTPTDNGVYIVGDKFDRIIMDSSTYGVPVNSPNGYKTPIDWATRISYSGIFFHSAPWSVGAQGSSNTSHGCLNLSPADAKWVYDNVKRGDITIVRNTVGGTLSGVDGLGDWNIPWEQWKAGNADRS